MLTTSRGKQMAETAMNFSSMEQPLPPAQTEICELPHNPQHLDINDALLLARSRTRSGMSRVDVNKPFSNHAS